jgi:hypothetical protein
MVKARKYSWRKTSLFFSRTLGSGTQFDRLPLEILKKIFKYKVIADDKLKKEKRKLFRERRVREIQEKQIKEKEERKAREKKRYEEEKREREKRQREEEDQKLKKKFGTATTKNQMERRKKLLIIRDEEWKESQRLREQWKRENEAFILKVRCRNYQPGYIDPFNFRF